jgi:hypothetical protein
MRSSTSPNVRAMPMTAVVLAVVVATQIVRTQPLSVLSQFGLTDQDIATVESGRPVTKVLPWGRPSEMYIFGAVQVSGSPAAYLREARDVKQFTTRPGYLAAGELSATATAADLEMLSFDADDIKAVKNCREGACDVQLPADSIRIFQNRVKWSDPDAPAEVNRLARGMLIDLVNAYRRGGNGALGAFDDKARPALIAREFETMVGRTAALPDVLPELRDYLLRYPDTTLPGAESFFYWEKVSFGLKPTIRLNHAVVYHTSRQGRDVDVVAIKQLYASHYFHTALDVSVYVADGAVGRPPGFYLLTLKSSEQEGLTGLKGSLLRKIVADKSRSSLDAALASIK